VAVAETGSGKTGAYTLPILDKLPKNFRDHFAIIMLPTRELALQVEEQIKLLGKCTQINMIIVLTTILFRTTFESDHSAFGGRTRQNDSSDCFG
jgi:superfamily II DNA/RNA helicase